MPRQATTSDARRLRRVMPLTERVLWKLLRDRKLADFKFRRQVPLGVYVADFVCLRHRLIVEADGPFHDAQTDAARDAWLMGQGFRVLRFANAEIDSAGYQVVDRILAAVEGLPPVRNR